MFKIQSQQLRNGVLMGFIGIDYMTALMEIQSILSGGNHEVSWTVRDPALMHALEAQGIPTIFEGFIPESAFVVCFPSPFPAFRRLHSLDAL